MSPIHSYSNWNVRSTNNEEQIDPYKRYYFICEGANTEKWYFEKIIDIKKELSIHSNIDVIYLEKTDEDKNLSSPKRLIEFAETQKKDKNIPFDSKFDEMVVVFDADIFEIKDPEIYNEIIVNGEKNNILCVTNPSFELFLLLHYENSFDRIIFPNEKQIILNSYVGNGKHKKRFIEDLFVKESGMNPKKNAQIADLAHNVLIAINQEKLINNDIHNCRGKLTSNIGQVLKMIIDDQCN